MRALPCYASGALHALHAALLALQHPPAACAAPRGGARRSRSAAGGGQRQGRGKRSGAKAHRAAGQGRAKCRPTHTVHATQLDFSWGPQAAVACRRQGRPWSAAAAAGLVCPARAAGHSARLTLRVQPTPCLQISVWYRVGCSQYSAPGRGRGRVGVEKGSNAVAQMEQAVRGIAVRLLRAACEGSEPHSGARLQQPCASCFSHPCSYCHSFMPLVAV